MKRFFIITLVLLMFTGCVSLKKYDTDMLHKEKRIAKLKVNLLKCRLRNVDLTKAVNKQKQQYLDISEKLKKQIIDGHIQIQNLKNKIVINIDDMICFKSGSATLSKDALDILKTITLHLNKFKNNKIIVEGNTDSIPIKKNSWVKDNWELSIQRALVVVRYLTTKIDPKRVSAAGYSKYNPLAPNYAPEGRKFNRRVDIVIIPE